MLCLCTIYKRKTGGAARLGYTLEIGINFAQAAAPQRADSELARCDGLYLFAGIGAVFFLLF